MGGGELVRAAKEAALDETAAELRAILDGMKSARRAVYLAVCRERTTELHSREYLRRHGIRGSGEVEVPRSGLPKPTDPLVALWVRERLGSGNP